MHVGVRFDDQETLTRAVAAYADHVTVDPKAVDDLSLSLHPAVDRAGNRARPSLRHGGCDVVRARSADRLLRALDSFLVTAVAVPDGCVRLAGIGALVRDGRAALVPASLLERSSDVERRIGEAGARLADAVSVVLDVRASEVVVVGGLAGTAALKISHAPALAPASRYELAAVHWTADEVVEDERRATAAVRLLRHVQHPTGVAPRELLDGVVAVADRCSDVVVGDGGPADLRSVLDRLGR